MKHWVCVFESQGCSWFDNDAKKGDTGPLSHPLRLLTPGACEKYGRSDVGSIASEMEGKSEEEVERYAAVFKERYKELNDYDQIIKNVERGRLEFLVKMK
ncbi:unnamed protein product [Lactuca saligna]|uniref:SANT domain-containing protein n=1 Tax=Lactuca saligna TaxID=75948 RepID=A0AA35YE59_LACSI|nr:unnamed protein product [Lactuca saligna]